MGNLNEGALTSMTNEDTTQGFQDPEQNNSSLSMTTPVESITKIADLQRMNMDQLTLFARNIGLKNLGALTKSQMVLKL